MYVQFSITVDGLHNERGSTAGSFTLLQTSSVFLGGPPPDAPKTLPGFFSGCIRKAELGADGLTLQLLELDSSSGLSSGTLRRGCREAAEPGPVWFTSPESYLALEPGWAAAARAGSLGLEFRTTEPDGLLVLGAGPGGDFVAAELRGGRLHAALDLGSGPVSVRPSARRLDDGRWHRLVLRRSARSGRLTLDDSAADFLTPGTSKQLDLEGPLFLGGLPSGWGNPPSEVWSAGLRRGFVGCLRAVTLDDSPVDLRAAARRQDSAAVRPACPTPGPALCPSRPCLNGGLCREGWHRFVCLCRHTAFLGPVCAKEAATLSFDVGQALSVSLGAATQAEDLSLRFRTTRPHGLLAATSGGDRSQLLLALESGRLRLAVALPGPDPPRVLYLGQGLNDDQWHTAEVLRLGMNVELRVDQDSLSRG
ncbi:NRXN2 [Cordylochernes scorpioides]|uniref:NRXN2 n=1 Tax=Cordylochernes scorpioides TaxID=51811 RepID=A0ABY6LB78_9ARAC|nr:NRXN2 [Cordylochernes scorpioides]